MAVREGNLQAPTRHALDWKSEDFWNEESLFTELERVYDICHGCRRCVSLCNAFPTLFDLVDESPTLEVDGIKKEDYYKVVEHCYLCDLCYMTKCPYVPPHEWNLDFPHLMLRAKAVDFKKHGTGARNKMLSSTDTVGKLAGIPVVAQVVNTANSIKPVRKIMQGVLGVHADAVVPKYHSNTARKRLKNHHSVNSAETTEGTSGKVALFTTCYGNYNEPHLGEDLVAVFEHNGIPVTLAQKEQCCGMPKLELGDLESVERAKNINVPMLMKLVNEGYDIVAPVSSCVLMFKQELSLMFPDDADVQMLKSRIFDPFEYLALRNKAGKLNTEFKTSLGKVAYHVACHQRVQNIGMKTKEILSLIPDTEVQAIERCSGHDGTYAVKKEYHDISMKIARPVVNKVKQMEADHYSSDCPMAGHQIENGLKDGSQPEHPLSLMRKAYDI
ncbi:MAG: heterodisulfide reductase-related iron-sulfur binding cluster [Gammaproteobacteria bacterium]|nr:heterodisulfide reductase-related iron-sulfur binding cluster [Gammaproteobacteria bacterium]